MKVVRNDFAGMLSTMRRRRGLTQEELAERAGLSVRAVSALERGYRRRPYPHTVRSLASALALDERELAEFKASVGERGRTSGLPVPPSSLIGRDADVEEIVEALLAPRTRLLTLVGPGGVGKTRLALAVGAELEPEFPDGVAFVSLAAVHDAGLLVPAVAHALTVQESGSQPLPELLRDYLRGRRVLLVIDNLEHLLAGAGNIASLLAAAPELHVLATSRAPLRLSGERVHPVTPLEPGPATELFRERASDATAGGQDVEPEVALDICRRLDGLPLAIELAAARTRVLPPPALRARLEQSLAILSGGARDLPERQQTLRGAIAWSHDLLTPPERELFRRLAVLENGWTLADVAAVAQLDEPRALELVGALVDASLVTREAAPGEPRFGMLETIHGFAAAVLESSEQLGLLRDRHAAHYRDLALAGAAGLFDATQAAWLDRLEGQHDNLRAASERLLDTGRVDAAASVTNALWNLWLIRGHLTEGQLCVDRVLDRRQELSEQGLGRALLAAGALQFARARYREAIEQCDQCALSSRAAGELETLALALTMSGLSAIFLGMPDVAERTLDEAETTALIAGQLYSAALIPVGRAHIAVFRGRLAEADRVLVEGEGRARELGAPWPLAACLNMRARVTLTRGDWQRAERLLAEGIACLDSIRDTWAMVQALIILADAAVAASDLARAARLFGAVDAISGRTGATLIGAHRRSSEPYRAESIARLGATVFDGFHLEGASLSRPELLALALRTTG